MWDPEAVRFTPLKHGFLSSLEMSRLLMACALGGAIGIERELRHKDSGLRTNMLICMASALFTMMSITLSGDSTANKGQIAANIVQGVGFLGAGLILHSKSRILGLTSAATVFVVAAIGMTCGAGLYWQAFVATIIVLIALQFVGALEFRVGWKRYPMVYEVRADVGTALPPDTVGQDRAEALAQDVAAAQHRMQRTILRALDSIGQRMTVLDRDNVAGMERVAFSVIATRKAHAKVLNDLRASDATDQVVSFKDLDD
jgi:putative Mg2+ transporter-C (MgtC) family protein